MNHELSRRAKHSQPSMIREILKVTQRPEVISLAGGLPAAELFPLEELSAAQDRVVAERGAAAFQYSVTEGVPELRSWVAQRMNTRYGCSIDPGDVMVTSGSQQGLDLYAKVLIDPGDIIVVEDPAYLGALQAFDAYEPEYLTVATDAGGIVPEELDAALRAAKKRPKFLYLIPNFENPTGITLARERRPKIVEICEAHDLPILEDDPYGEICFDAGGPPPPLISYAKKAGITYLGTGSKIASPGLRVAWAITRNKSLHDKLVTAKQGADLCSSPWAQYVLYEFVRSEPRLQAHLDVVRAAYRSRRDAMIGALAATMPKDAAWNTPSGGMFLWVTLPGVDTDELFEVAARDNVVFVPGRTFFAHRDRADGMRLNFSAMNEDVIREGIERLGKAVREFEGAPA